ncbi:MAG: TIGR03067 domain-containing protein [Planctomycetota bacterium]
MRPAVLPSLLIAGLVVVPALTAAPPTEEEPNEAVKKELAALVGKYQGVSAETAGGPMGEEFAAGFEVSFAADGTGVGTIPGGAAIQYKIIIDPAAEPKTMDIVHTGGVHNGQTQYCVYERDENGVTVCVTRPGAKPEERPASLKPGPGHVRLGFKKIEEKPDDA